MSDETADVLARVLRELPAVTARVRSVDDVASWLAAQPGVVECRVDPALLKSQPPQQLIHLVLAAGGGSRGVTLKFAAHASGALELLSAT